MPNTSSRKKDIADLESLLAYSYDDYVDYLILGLPRVISRVIELMPFLLFSSDHGFALLGRHTAVKHRKKVKDDRNGCG